MIRRNTIQRDLVMKAVTSLRNHATAEEIYEYIKKDQPALGKGTVYRNLNILVGEDRIQKVVVPDGPDRYDHNCSKHYHVKCVKCNKVSDVKMDYMPDLLNMIEDREGMLFLDYKISFDGICPSCQKKENV